MIFRQLYLGKVVLHLVYFGNQVDVTEDALLDENVKNCDVVYKISKFRLD